MKLVLRVIPECIDVVKQDVEELINKKSHARGSLVFIDDCSVEDASILAYRCQSIYDIGISLSEEEICAGANPQDHEISVKKNTKKLLDILNQGKSFKIQTIKCIQEDVQSTEFNAAVGNAVWEVAKENNKELAVDLNKPDIVLTYFIEKEQSVLCLDLIGSSLNKRPYKIFSQSNSLNSVLAYCFAKLSGATNKGVFVDCCCGSGVIPIELAQHNTQTSSFIYEKKFMGLRYDLTKEAFTKTQNKTKNNVQEKTHFSKQKIYGFDYVFSSINNAKKNAKLAGVLDALHFSKVALDWVDSKFEKGEVDVLVGNLPKLSQRSKNDKEIKKFLDELFYQARFIVKPTGFVGVLFNNEKMLEEASVRHGFTSIEKRTIKQGEQEYLFMKFSCPKEPSED